MAIRDIFKISRRTFFNPVGWVDYDTLREQNQTVVQTLKNQFTTPTAEREETYQQAMKRMEVTEEDMTVAAQNYRVYAVIFAGIGLLLFLYAFYLLFRYGSFFAWILGMAVCTLSLAQAFRYDFWSFQIRKKQLGVTFEDWKNDWLGIETKKSKRNQP